MQDRLRVAGLFVRKDKVLLVKHRKNDKEYFLLPGGGVDPGETIVEALEREFREELTIDIEVGELLFAGESMPPPDSDKSHVRQIVFEVRAISGSIEVQPDGVLFDFEWMSLADLKSAVLFPDCAGQIVGALQGDLDRYEVYSWKS